MPKYYTAIVPATDADNTPARIEVCASIGEFDPGQTIVEVFGHQIYEMLCLDVPGAEAMRDALNVALAIHAEHAGT